MRDPLGPRESLKLRRCPGLWLVSLVSMLAAASGCLGLRTTVRASPASLATATTFTFFDAEHGRTGSLDRDTQIVIESALRRGLESRGFVPSAEADLLVSFTALSEPVEGFAAIGYQLPGGFGGGFDIGATVTPLLERMELEVTVLDLRTNRVALYLRTTGKVPRGRQLRRIRSQLTAALAGLPASSRLAAR